MVGDLWQAPLRDKRFIDEVMAGLAWRGIGSPDGQWLLTLYLTTERNVAFIHTARFAAGGGAELAAPLSQSILSENGRWLYFSDGRSAWLYDVKTREVSGPLVTNQSIQGLGVSDDGRRLYVARAGQPVLVVNTASGQVLP